MNYQVLARKWRPRTFQEMVGQEQVLRMLKNALEQKRLHHAYLFTGTRGVGKTTLGRILAKCLNCETGPTASPCGTCFACINIDAGQFLDLYEVDAASRTKVEDTRDLLENVLYPPTKGRYKVYLIDEVQMLSQHSFNALLKTLEEPPAHVKFLLATTEPKRLPITILSRCLQFHLKRLTPEQIATHLKYICEAEAIPYEPLALAHLAKAADGGMRDALSLLDQAIAYGGGKVCHQDVMTLLGSMTQDDLLPLLEALSAQNGKQLFNCLQQLTEHAPDFHSLLEELISIFHNIAMIQIVPDAIAAPEEIRTLAAHFTPEEVQLYYQIALLGRRDLSLAPSPHQGFEMTMLRMLAFKPSLIADGAESSPDSLALTPPPSCPEKNGGSIPTPPDGRTWRDILPQLGLSGMAYALASNCVLEKITDNHVTLALSDSQQPMLNQKLKDRLADALSHYFKRDIQLDIHITSSSLMTPLKQQQDEHREAIAKAKESIMKDPQIKKLIEMYDATIEISSV